MSDINYIEEIRNYCLQKLTNLSEEYQELFKKEMKDLTDWQTSSNINMAKKVWTLKQTTPFPLNSNQSGSLLLFLLDISSIDPIKNNITPDIISLVEGSMPDVDTDFTPDCREWVKNYISNKFGHEKTCSIGTYQKYKTRACIVDVARALGHDVHEIQDITKKISPLSSHENEDGEDEKIDEMEWEDIFEIYPELSNYMDNNPEVLKHCKILRNQVKNMGKHAGGVIISNLNLQNKIPVIRDKSGQIVSTWQEGQATQELSANCGLVKIDALGLSNLKVNADCVKLIKQIHGIDLRPEDIPIDDHHAIKFSSHNDLVGIFQFESPATRPLADAIGMESIEDISAATSLLRPGPKDMGLHMEYAERKNGKKYDSPDFMRKILSVEHSILIYQENVMRIAQELAGFTPVESNKLRSVISKKKKDEIPKMKDKFFKGSQKRIDAGEITLEEVQKIWDTFVSFCSYAFNRCLSPYTQILYKNGKKIEKKYLKDFNIGDIVYAYNGNKMVETDVVSIHDNGLVEGIEIEFDDGNREICSKNHKFLTKKGMIPLYQILEEKLGIISYAKSTTKPMLLRNDVYRESQNEKTQGKVSCGNQSRKRKSKQSKSSKCSKSK